MAENGFNGGIEAAANQLEMVGRAIVGVMPAAAAAGAEVLQPVAESLAPRLSGGLSLSGGNEPVEEGDGNSAAHRVYFASFHARFQEFGVAHHAAQPFLRPAAELNQGQIEAAMREVLDRETGNAIVQYRGVMSGR